MRWDVVKPRTGDSRIVTKFLWLPLVLRGEGRWLEFASIKQIYGMKWRGKLSPCPAWINSDWFDPEPESPEVLGGKNAPSYCRKS